MYPIIHKDQMAAKKYMRISYPSSEKIFVPGEIHKIRVAMRQIKLADTEVVTPSGDVIVKKNKPVIVYDTSGVYSDTNYQVDFSEGLNRSRETWYENRKDLLRLPGRSVERVSTDETVSLFPKAQHPYRAKRGKKITQMYYAKRRIITPEMEYVAIRENQQVEALGLKSYITPEFIRKEVAAGRAVIPANVNHPEAEPMIIGKKFLVKTTINIGHTMTPSGFSEGLERVLGCCKWGCDGIMDVSQDTMCHAHREWLIRNSPIPVGTVPLFQALDRVNGKVEDLTWEVYRDTLIEQAEQGVDCFTIHAGLLRSAIEKTAHRLTGIVSRSGLILAKWMDVHQEENFLYTHFDEICDLLAAYDVTLSIGHALRSGSIYDANDSAQFAELSMMGQLTQKAWSHFVQVIVEGPGHVPMNKIPELVKELDYLCQGAPFYAVGPITTDIAPAYQSVTSTIGAAQIAWLGTSMLCSTIRKDQGECPSKEMIRSEVTAYKIASHAADLADRKSVV